MPLTLEELRKIASDPVPGDAPAGKDVRLEPAFVALQAEIDKLSSMTGASGGVVWPHVEALASEVLRDFSKDILAAVYLAVAVEENSGPAGISEGAEFLADFIGGWWEGLLPPIKRIRARVNAVEWWRDRTVQLISKYQGPPLPQASVEAARASVIRLDTVLGGTSEALPSVREVERTLAAIPVEAAPPDPVPAPPAAGAAGSLPLDAAPATPPNSQDPQAGLVSGYDALHAVPVKPEASTASAGAVPVPAPGTAPARTDTRPPAPPAQAQEGEGPDSPGARAALKALLGCADVFLSYYASSLEMPRYWDVSRLRLWLPVSALPPSENGKTMLLPPPPEIMANLMIQLDGGAFGEALASVEDRRSLYVFWLDLDRIAARALDAMGRKDCSAVLLARAASFAASLPGIEALAFEDGTPFASGDTREWLASSVTEVSGTGGGAPESALYDCFLEGDASRSLSRLGESASRPRTGREVMLASAVEMRLYLRTGRALEAAALARWAVSECELLDLSRYDPEVCAKAMSAAVFVLKGAGPEFKGDCLRALGCLMRCGPLAVSELQPVEIL
jgi:type VI secretion system protein VasJ